MGDRAEAYAAEYEATAGGFARLIGSLSDEQWARVGANYPQRLNEEDETRSVAVIAHHAAESAPWIMERTQALVRGEPFARPAGLDAANARHAVEHAGATREEVLAMLRESTPRIAAVLRGLSDAQLDIASDTPAGRLSVAQRIERVLIGHLRMHQGSIEAAIS